MLRLAILITMFATFALPTLAQDADRISKMLTESTAAFKENNYFLGVGKVQQACGMMRANPSAVSDCNYIDVATSCLDGVKTNIATLQAKGDTKGVAQRVQALQPLLQSLMEWDRNNPRWHYEKGNLLCAESMAYNNVGFTMQAEMEYKQALRIDNGGAYRENCQRQLEICQKAVAQGWNNARAWDRAHPVRYSAPDIKPSSQSRMLCPLCGHTHGYNESCWH